MNPDSQPNEKYFCYLVFSPLKNIMEIYNFIPIWAQIVFLQV